MEKSQPRTNSAERIKLRDGATERRRLQLKRNRAVLWSAWLGIVIMELTQLLKDAQQEIQQLRRRNEILGAKVEVMDSFMCVLHTKPAEHLQVMSVDIARQLGQKVAEIEANRPAEAQMPNAGDERRAENPKL